MALWSIVRLHRGNEGVRLRYTNLYTGKEFDLGGVSSDVDDVMVLRWIFNHAEHVAEGDWLRLSDGRLLRYLSERGRS